jgi:hypothetical protein
MKDYLSFTKSSTKIAHTPTVSGNKMTCALWIEFALGRVNVKADIAIAVSTPRTNFAFQLIVATSK